MLGRAATGRNCGSCPSWSMLRFGHRVSWFQGATRPVGIKSLEQVDAGNRTVSHAEKNPLLKKNQVMINQPNPNETVAHAHAQALAGQ